MVLAFDHLFNFAFTFKQLECSLFKKLKLFISVFNIMLYRFLLYKLILCTYSDIVILIFVFATTLLLTSPILESNSKHFSKGINLNLFALSLTQ